MGKNFKIWLLNKLFKDEIEEYKEIIKELCRDLEREALDNMCNINATEKLMKELQQAKDEIKVYEELIDNLDKENKMMNLILQSLKLYQ